VSCDKKTSPSPADGGTPANCTTAPCRTKCEPNNESTVSGNRIDIVFDPDKSCKVTKCDRIVHIQFIQIYVDGKLTKPGDFHSGFKYRDKVVTDKGWWIDHLATETTPDYQQGNGDGKKNGGSTKARIMDAPEADSADGGTGGPYDPASHPTGWKKVDYKFQTYAWCMKGPDCGKWYEGIGWQYTKTWEDVRDSKPGNSTITDRNIPGAPPGELIDAFDKFNNEKGFKPCT
jgi:hypothetical protein